MGGTFSVRSVMDAVWSWQSDFALFDVCIVLVELKSSVEDGT